MLHKILPTQHYHQSNKGEEMTGGLLSEYVPNKTIYGNLSQDFVMKS